MKGQSVDDLGIKVKINREFSYTDKKFGYYYGATHDEVNESWFAGWNLNTKRVLKDYDLFIDRNKIIRKTAIVTVYPYKLVRQYKECKEEFYLFDEHPIIAIKLSNIKGKEIGLKITGALDSMETVTGEGLFMIPKESTNDRILVTTYASAWVSLKDSIVSAPKEAGGFVIIYGKNKKEILDELSKFRLNGNNWLKERFDRMNTLITKNTSIIASDDKLTKSLNWIMLTTDELVMNQMGWGIYAGLPWFNDYWGRDLFITFPGACLVTGQFETAKKILLSFAKFQNNDKNSKYYGRIPNRARPDEIIYNSTDGTPRMVIEIMDYVKYTGDTGIIRELYPVIKKAIDGAITYWVDDKGYLTHDDADTWMDAREKGVRPFSPRGNRANDIQSLWYQQLLASAKFAEFMMDNENYDKWLAMAKKVKNSFVNDFFDSEHDYMADRISRDGTKDFKLRPNQLYAFELLNDENQRMTITKTVWSGLVYPWGVASLSQKDEDFYPYHENWHYYHKDAAYHNGTIWLWNNGMAMQRMIEFGQKETAYKLFKNMNRQALDERAIGSLGENADALPRDGKKWVRRSGTFLQAWSNAEQVRVWYQYFLGIQPALDKKEIQINPQIPNELKDLKFSVLLANGKLSGEYKSGTIKKYTYKLTNIPAKIKFTLPNFKTVKIDLEPGYSIKIIKSDVKLVISLFDENNKIIKSSEVLQNPVKMNKAKNLKAFFKEIDFCKPFLQKGLKSLSTYHEKALEY